MGDVGGEAGADGGQQQLVGAVDDVVQRGLARECFRLIGEGLEVNRKNRPQDLYAGHTPSIDTERPAARKVNRSRTA